MIRKHEQVLLDKIYLEDYTSTTVIEEMHRLLKQDYKTVENRVQNYQDMTNNQYKWYVTMVKESPLSL